MKKVVITFVGIAFTLFLLLLVAIVLVFVSHNGFGEGSSNSDHIYQVSRFDTKTNSTTRGIANLNRILSNEDFLSYRSRNNEVFSSISRVSSDDYKCYGTCSCEEGIQNRRITSVLSKSLYFIVSAISLSLAINIAKSFFHEECKFSLSECEQENISSDVEYCETTKTTKGKAEVAESAYVEEREELEREFQCTGYCLPNNKLSREELVFLRDDFKCGSKRLEERVKVKVPFHFHKLTDKYKPIAKARFMQENLRPFCKKISMVIHPMKYRHSKRDYIETRRERKWLCVGSRHNEKVENVECSFIRDN